MRADGLADCLPFFLLANSVTGRERYIAPDRATSELRAQGGWASISGGEEVLLGGAVGGAPSGSAATEPLPRPAWLFQAGPLVLNVCATPNPATAEGHR